MADGSRAKPKGVLPKILIIVAGVRKVIGLVVLDIEEDDPTQLVLRRTCISRLKLIHDWGLDELTIIRDIGKVVLHTNGVSSRPPLPSREFIAIDWFNGIDDDEEYE